MKRSRGSQPGNTKALKHGLYSSRFRPFEKKPLNEIPFAELEAEIDSLRIFLQRFLGSEQNTASQDFETRRSSLLTACFAIGRITSLVRIQSRYRGCLLEPSHIKAWLEGLPSGETGENVNMETQE